MKLSKAFGISAGVLVLALSSSALRAVVVYNDSVNDLAVNFNTGGLLVGDEITLGGTVRQATNFVIQYYLMNPIGDEQMEVRFYQNNGPANINGTFNPGLVIFDSGKFNVTGTSRSTLDFNLSELS